MVFDCLWVVVEFFEVVVDGFSNYAKRGEQLWQSNLDGRLGDLFAFHAQMLTKFTFHLHF